MTKYTVTINETKRTITVDLDGYKGEAKCCPTDLFDIKVGTELALERAKVAKENANKPANKMDLMEAVKLVESLLPKGECVVIGNGKELTKQNKEWLHSLTDCECDGSCSEREDFDVDELLSLIKEEVVAQLTEAVEVAVEEAIENVAEYINED
jgi:hypothetical protein